MMSLTTKLVPSLVIAAAMALGVTSASAQGTEFDGTGFTCLQYTNSQAENSSTKAQSGLARMWVMGYLAGYYKAKGNLQIVDDAKAGDDIAKMLASKCKEAPQVSIWAVSGFLAGDARKVPTTASESLNLNTYTCGAHVDAKAGSSAEMMKSDLADLWSFAFIQGYKNFTNKDMVITIDNKPVLTGAVAKNCGKNRDKTFLDLTAMVAQAVKLGG